jgi:hypothetical protein
LALHEQYYALYFPLWNARRSVRPKKLKDFVSIDAARERNDRALADSVRFVAALSRVDGAVIISDRLRVVGFGAEVIAQSPSLTRVAVADENGRRRAEIAIESFGTRHRSAFRFCSSFEQGVAFVVSQDGAVRAAKRVGSDLVLWPDVNTRGLGL